MMPHVVIEIFLWLLGLCVGSFLNVVIYRLPLGLSIADPPRSFCPRCRHGIAWFDNIPILSWWLLGGRCRNCTAPISVQYPLVEGLTGLTFLLVYHLLFVAEAHADLPSASFLTDLPVLAAWLLLATGLVACAAMDIVSYTVDIRVTDIVLYAGIVLHALWPRGDILVPSAQSPIAAALVAVGLVSVAMLWWTVWRPESDAPPEPPLTAPPDDAATPQTNGLRAGARFAVLIFVALAGWLFYAGVVGPDKAHGPMAVGAALLAAFAGVVLIGGQQRPADAEIKAAIDEEQPRARRTAWRELAWLTPSILIGMGVFVAMTRLPGLEAGWRNLVAWAPLPGFTPLAGALDAVQGAIIGAAAGWVLRIVFTLAFGREALGVGDIYILAAAGATAGWDIALCGLLLSVGIALAGWVLGLLLKSTVLIPFGPWLALGFLLALWWNRAARGVGEMYRDNLLYACRQEPHLIAIIAGLMLVGTAAAIALAKLLRRWISPDEPLGPAAAAPDQPATEPPGSDQPVV